MWGAASEAVDIMFPSNPNPASDEGYVRLCTDVTAYGQVLRWKVTKVWFPDVRRKELCERLAVRPGSLLVP